MWRRSPRGEAFTIFRRLEKFYGKGNWRKRKAKIKRILR